MQQGDEGVISRRFGGKHRGFVFAVGRRALVHQRGTKAGKPVAQ